MYLFMLTQALGLTKFYCYIYFIQRRAGNVIITKKSPPAAGKVCLDHYENQMAINVLIP